jgi:hypothetical protein
MTLVKDLKAKLVNADVYVFPIKDGNLIRLYRTTLMKVAGWTFSGIYSQKGKYDYDTVISLYKSVPENQKVAKFLKDLANMDTAQAQKAIEGIKDWDVFA